MTVKNLVPWKRDQGHLPVHRSDDAFDLFSHFDRFFESFFGDSRLPSLWWNASREWTYSPRVDIRETDETYELSAELPGLDERDVEVTLENGILRISGEKREEREEKKDEENYYRRERTYGRFERSFRLPDGIEGDKIEARYKNGVLHISVPKSEEAKKAVHKVEVKAG